MTFHDDFADFIQKIEKDLMNFSKLPVTHNIEDFNYKNVNNSNQYFIVHNGLWLMLLFRKRSIILISIS